MKSQHAFALLSHWSVPIKIRRLRRLVNSLNLLSNPLLHFHKHPSDTHLRGNIISRNIQRILRSSDHQFLQGRFIQQIITRPGSRSLHLKFIPNGRRCKSKSINNAWSVYWTKEIESTPSTRNSDHSLSLSA